MQKIQLSIPEPCHENWDNMSPTQKGRFCNACAKEVVDFSSMSDTQVLNYFNSDILGKVCGRAYPDQLDRVIAMPEKPKRKWYWNYAAAFFLFFAKSNETKAQGMVAVRKTEKTTPKKDTVKVCTKKVDALNRPIITAGGIRRVDIKEQEPLLIIDGVLTDEKRLKDLDPNSIASINVLTGASATALYGSRAGNAGVIVVTTKKKELVPTYWDLDTVKVKTINYTQINIKPITDIYHSTTMGAVIPGISIVTKTDTLKTFVNSILSPVKIYPDPAKRGEIFNLTFSTRENSRYTIQTINAAGIILQQQQITAASKTYTQQIEVGVRWAAGAYYIRIFDDKNKLINKSSFIVQ